MLPLGKVAQGIENRGLAVNRRLRVELLSVEREAAVHKVEVIAQRIGELDVRGIRLDVELDGPVNLGHTVSALGEGPRLRSREVAVLGGDHDRPRTGEFDGRAAA